MTDPTPLDDLLPAEREALFDHLAENPDALEAHIRDGGTLGDYAALWKAARDAAAQSTTITPETIARALAAPVERSQGETVRDYLTELLAQFWLGEADGKYGMTGGSDWRYDLYDALNRAGLIPGYVHGYGIGYRTESHAGPTHPDDRRNADRLVVAAIRSLAKETP